MPPRPALAKGLRILGSVGIVALVAGQASAGGPLFPRRTTYAAAPVYYQAPSGYSSAPMFAPAYAPGYAPMNNMPGTTYVTYGPVASSTTAAAPVAAAPVAAAPVAAAPTADDGTPTASDTPMDAPSMTIFRDDLRKFYATSTDAETGLAKIAALQTEAETRFKAYRDARNGGTGTDTLSENDKTRLNDLVQQVVRESIDRDNRERYRQGIQPYNQGLNGNGYSPYGYGNAPYGGSVYYVQPPQMFYQPVVYQPIPTGHKQHIKRW